MVAKELAFIRARGVAMTEELQVAKEVSRELEVRVVEAEKEAQVETERAQTVKLKLAEDMVKVASLKFQLEGAGLRANGVEALAQDVVEEARHAREETTRAKVEAGAARDEAARAVELYKGSTDFVDEVAEAAYDAFLKRFEEYKNKVAQDFNIIGLDNITVEDLDEQRYQQRRRRKKP